MAKRKLPFVCTGSVEVTIHQLVKHYGLHDDEYGSNWFWLAYQLVSENPDFAASPIRKAPGRKPERYAVIADWLLFVNLSLAEAQRNSVKAKAQHLVGKHPMFKGKNPGTLRDRYYLLKDARSKEHKRVLDFCESMVEVNGPAMAQKRGFA
jgi:hypothetical protein